MGAIYRIPMGPKGMIGGSVGGLVLGLQAGILTWLIQLLSGETIVERWEREYRIRTQDMDQKDQEFTDKDAEKRFNLDQNETGEREKEENSWSRQIVVKVRKWLDDNGFGWDDYKVMHESETNLDRVESEKVKVHEAPRTN